MVLSQGYALMFISSCLLSLIYKNKFKINAFSKNASLRQMLLRTMQSMEEVSCGCKMVHDFVKFKLAHNISNVKFS